MENMVDAEALDKCISYGMLRHIKYNNLCFIYVPYIMSTSLHPST